MYLFVIACLLQKPVLVPQNLHIVSYREMLHSLLVVNVVIIIFAKLPNCHILPFMEGTCEET